MNKEGFIRRDTRIIKENIRIIEKKLGLFEHKIYRAIFHFHYPKILALIVLAIIAYFIFKTPNVQIAVESLGQLQYLGVFIAGMFFTFGFTTPFAIGFFVVLNPVNPVLTALVGGMGAVIGDMAIFGFIRFSFTNEFERLKKTSFIRGIKRGMRMYLSHRIRLYILYALAGLIIASPLPDEAGVIMLAGLTNISPRIMGLISFVFNTIGIFIICLI